VDTFGAKGHRGRAGQKAMLGPCLLDRHGVSSAVNTHGEKIGAAPSSTGDGSYPARRRHRRREATARPPSGRGEDDEPILRVLGKRISPEKADNEGDGDSGLVDARQSTQRRYCCCCLRGRKKRWRSRRRQPAAWSSTETRLRCSGRRQHENTKVGGCDSAARRLLDTASCRDRGVGAAVGAATSGSSAGSRRGRSEL
jgi:hypothetical protein